MKRLTLLAVMLLVLLMVTACSKPPYTMLMNTDSLIRYQHEDDKASRKAIYRDAQIHCSHSKSEAIHGKTFCDAERCETSYFCE